MARVKEVRQCVLCGKDYHRANGNVKAKYCSIRCSCRSHHTKEFQQRAGKIGGMVVGNRKRGTGIIGYIKRNQKHEHRTEAEKMLGRKLKKGEIVHHKDGNKHNNFHSNLEVITQSKHASIHFKEMWRARKEKELCSKQ